MHAAQARSAPRSDIGEVALTGDSAAGLFAALGGSDLAEGGKALVLSLAPLKAALGPSWDTARAKIHTVLERSAGKHLTGSDIWRAIDDTLYLAATPDKSAIHAMALCHRAARDAVIYFQGRIRPAHLVVSRIPRLTAEAADLTLCSSIELENADIEAVSPPLPPPKPPASPGGAISVQSSPADGDLAAWQLQTSDGQHLRASFAVDPVMDLKAWAMAGHRIESRIMTMGSGVELTAQQRRNLQPWDFEKIDVAALGRGISRLAGGEIPDRPKLIVQLSFASLSNGKARNTLLEMVRDPRKGMKQAAICEIVDVESGVPVGRLVEVASLVRNSFRSIWVQVAPQRQAVETAIAAKITGLTVRASELGDTDQDIAAGLRRFAAMVKRPNTLMIATALPATNLMIDAMSAGFSHATLRARPAPAPAVVEIAAEAEAEPVG